MEIAGVAGMFHPIASFSAAVRACNEKAADHLKSADFAAFASDVCSDAVSIALLQDERSYHLKMAKRSLTKRAIVAEWFRQLVK